MASEDFKYGDAQTDGLANRDRQVIDIYHVTSGLSVRFKAFVNTFSDQYTSDWNSETVFGRMDPIQTFKNTSRKISLGWDVPAASFLEAKENMKKASLLLSMLYPEYDDDSIEATNSGGATTMKAPPMFKVKFLNLIQDATALDANTGTAKSAGLLGTIGGFTFEPDLESGFFQPATSTPGGPTQLDIDKLFPKSLKFQAEFTVLHQHKLGWRNSKIKRRDGFDAFPYGIDSGDQVPPPNIAPGNPDTVVRNADGSINKSQTDLANKNKKQESVKQRRDIAAANKLGGIK